MKTYERVLEVRGWGLDRPGREWDCTPVGAPTGCTSETCQHVSHSPATPTYSISPPAGTVIRFLKSYPATNDGRDDYYVVIYGDGTREVLDVYEPRFFWSVARLVELHDESLSEEIRVLAMHASRDSEFPDQEVYKKRLRQTRDALNKLRDPEILEAIARILRV